MKRSRDLISGAGVPSSRRALPRPPASSPRSLVWVPPRRGGGFATSLTRGGRFGVQTAPLCCPPPPAAPPCSCSAQLHAADAEESADVSAPGSTRASPQRLPPLTPIRSARRRRRLLEPERPAAAGAGRGRWGWAEARRRRQRRAAAPAPCGSWGAPAGRPPRRRRGGGG